jgi:TPR repeat protein
MKKAVPLLEKACNGDDMVSCRLLARAYQQGMGVNQDAQEATFLRDALRG